MGPAVTDALRALGLQVERVAGATAAGTAAALAGTLAALPVGSSGASGSSPGGAVLVAATRAGLADAVTAGAAAAATGRPVLLVTSRGVPAETAAALRMLDVTSATVVADPAVVPDAALRGLAALGVRHWTRVSGSGRAGNRARARPHLPRRPAGSRRETPGSPPQATSPCPTPSPPRRPDGPVLLVPGVLTAGLADWFARWRPRATWVLGGSGHIPTALLADLTAAAPPTTPPTSPPTANPPLTTKVETR